MSERPDAWMPLYIGDYLADTAHLDCQQHGAYLLIIMAYWRAGGALPDDDTKLARIVRLAPAKWRAIRPAIADFFEVVDGQWKHSRIEREIDAALSNKERQRQRTVNATAARRGRNDERDVPRNEAPDDNVTTDVTRSPSPSPSPSPSSLRSDSEAQLTLTPPEPEKPKRGSRIDPDWMPGDPATLEFCRQNGLDLDDETQRFRDYWLGESGKAASKLDWDRTFMNRLKDRADFVKRTRRAA